MSPDSSAPESSFVLPPSPTTTEPAPEPAPPTESSLVTMVPKYFADHKQIDVQRFAYDEGKHKRTEIRGSKEFFAFLHVNVDSLLSNLRADRRKFTKAGDFLDSANAVAESVRLDRECLHPLHLAFLVDI